MLRSSAPLESPRRDRAAEAHRREAQAPAVRALARRSSTARSSSWSCGSRSCRSSRPGTCAERAHAEPRSTQPVRQRCPSICRARAWCTTPRAACPDCGAALRRIGEDVSEVLDYVPERFKVIRHVRPKLACPAASASCRSPAPSRRSSAVCAGPGLLAPRPHRQVRRSPAALPAGADLCPRRASSSIARRWPMGRRVLRAARSARRGARPAM